MVGLGVDDVYHCSADAVVKSTLLVVKRSALIALADTDHNVAHLLWTLTAQELRRLQEHMMLLIRSAQERVACFLLEMAERMAETDVIDLPMSRQDIADYLGLTIETISRTLTQLETAAAISVPNCRRIILYLVHVMTRKSFGLMTRKLSVTESQRSAQFPGTFSRRKLSVASANWAQVA